ncbi:MAG: hypothetical protein OXP09_08375 [Gammaproteobacteria bacterium]|nr:hypothetical protein [Gammaproteobacteria bacterium]
MDNLFQTALTALLVAVITAIVTVTATRWSASQDRKLVHKTFKDAAKRWEKNHEGVGYKYLLRDFAVSTGNPDLLAASTAIHSLEELSKTVAKLAKTTVTTLGTEPRQMAKFGDG